jgi:hypothetical protein
MLKNSTTVWAQSILAGIEVGGDLAVDVTTHGGGRGADGSSITATFGEQLMITIYDREAAAAYVAAWMSPQDAWAFEHLPATDPRPRQAGSFGPSLSIRAHGAHRIVRARYDSTSGTAVVRIGPLTWAVRDQVAAHRIQDAWRYVGELAPVVLNRLLPTPRHR